MKAVKNIVVICASPNKGEKGNSETLAHTFVEGVKEAAPDANVEVFNLYDVPMAMYDFSHKATTDAEPELFALMNAIQKADGLVVATPTWNFNVPAVLKNLIDRMGYFALDYKTMNAVGQPTGQLGRLKVQTLITGGTPWHLRIPLFFLFPGFWLRAVMAYYGAFSYRSMYVGEATYGTPVSEKPDILKKAHAKGKQFATWLG